MTVQAGPVDKRYDANGVALAYTIPFLLIAASDLDVYLNGTLITTGFTITGVGNPTSTITFTTAPTGDLYLVLDVPFERLIDYQENGDFLASTVNRDYDRIWQALKQLLRGSARALTLGPSDVDGAGSYRANNNRIQDLADPIAQQDAVNLRTLLEALADFSTDGSGQFVLQMLADATGAGLGDALIGVLQPFTGAAQQTQHDKNSQTVHINDFPSTPANTWLSRAIDGTPVGATLQLGRGPYLANFTKIRNDIRIVGVGLPAANAGRTALAGGTIIQGKFRLSGNNIAVEMLGVDCGIDVCVAINGGFPMDALVVNGQNPALITNVIVRDVCGLCKSPTDSVHPMLLEALNVAFISNVHGYLGFTGPVIKAQRAIVTGVYGYKNSQSGMQIKSNSYAPCNRLLVDNVVVTDEGLAAANSAGIFIYAEDAQLANLIMGKSLIRGFDNSCALNGVATVINDIHLGDMVCETPLGFGLVCDGPVQKVSAGTVKVVKPVSGRFVRISSDNLGFNIDSIEGTAPAGLTLADSIQLGGVFRILDIDTTTNGIPGTPTGVAITPHAGFPREWRILSYRATLAVNSGAAGYRNGWGTANGDTVRVWVEGNTVHMRGSMTIPAGAARVGAEQFYQVNPLLAPPVGVGEKRKGHMSLYTSGTVANISSECWVDAAGVVSAPYLSNTAHFPTTVVQATIDMNWPLK